MQGLDDLQYELMLYGWQQMEERMMSAAVGVSGYDAWEAICRAFYRYATGNPGVFSAMLWYNKYKSDEVRDVTEGIFFICSKITSSLHISEEKCNHLIRTFRAFLEGFSLLVNNKAFLCGYSHRIQSCNRVINSCFCGIADSPVLIKQKPLDQAVTTFAVRFHFWAVRLFSEIDVRE